MNSTTSVFRFAPSPNGELHLGHAYSAMLNLKMARMSGGKMLLRIEDIDRVRCRPELEKQMLEDLEWLGFEWDEPPLRQSERFMAYQEVLKHLNEIGVIYPAALSRGEIKRIVSRHDAEGRPWPRDPDGAPVYPGTERNFSQQQRKDILEGKKPFNLRLDLSKAMQTIPQNIAWIENNLHSSKQVTGDPQKWGDVVLARKHVPASYHLCCVVDDAFLGITHIVRGQDLFESTSVHRLLQKLLGFATPTYFHHPLVLDKAGKKLSKSDGDTSIRQLRNNGETAASLLDRLYETGLPEL